MRVGTFTAPQQVERHARTQSSLLQPSQDAQEPQDVFTPSEGLQLAAAEIQPLRIPLGAAPSPTPAPTYGRLTPEMQERLMRARPLEGGRTGYGK